MTLLENSGRPVATLLKADQSPTVLSDRSLPKHAETAEFARFKSQLKRAFDSVEAPQYLIDAIKISIRREE